MSEAKFKVGSQVIYLKSGIRYTILKAPPTNLMKVGEEWVPCYSYQISKPQINSHQELTFQRSQKEMEDGRFVEAPTTA